MNMNHICWSTGCMRQSWWPTLSSTAGRVMTAKLASSATRVPVKARRVKTFW